jgi:O-antigen/teichoic acid export membrane protein
MNLGQSIRAGAKWLIIGKAGTRFLELVYGVILARLLVPADFGMIVTIGVFTGFVGMLATGGMGQSLIRAKEADESDFTAVFTLQLALGILVYSGFFVAAPWFAEYFGNPLYTDLIRVSTIVFLMRPFAYIRASWLSREMQFKKRSMIDVANGALTGVASVLMAWFGLGVWSLTLSGLIGALSNNILLARITPLRLRLNLDFSIIRKHGAFGFKITANDFLSYLTRESKNLIISKLAGPAFLGLFNKADSLARIPNQLIVPATIEPVFRAMSKVQDDLDQTKYLFYRTITLFMVYTTPIYIGLWWVAEPFIGVVYGEKWVPAAGPLAILVLAGVFRTIGFPCAALLAAQNRLGQEMLAITVNLFVVSAACIIGLQWGLEGVAWGLAASQVFGAVFLFVLAYRVLPTRITDLLRAIGPGLMLNVPLIAGLALTHFALRELLPGSRLSYLVLMTLVGTAVYTISFLFLPIPAISTEAARWRNKFSEGLRLLRKANH